MRRKGRILRIAGFLDGGVLVRDLQRGARYAAAVPRTLILAHRGARAVQPENTIAAFETAVSLGADGVELDVHRSADGELLVDHDGRHDELGPLTDQPFAIIRATAPSIPTLREVFAAIGDTVINVEIKNLPGDPGWDTTDEIADRVVAYIDQYVVDEAARARLIVSSFNLDTIDRVHALAPDLTTGFLSLETFDSFDALRLASDRGHRALHPHVNALAGDVAVRLCATANQLGVAINPWTVNDPIEMRRLANAGVNALITDVPDVAASALRQ